MWKQVDTLPAVWGNRRLMGDLITFYNHEVEKQTDYKKGIGKEGERERGRAGEREREKERYIKDMEEVSKVIDLEQGATRGILIIHCQ